ncbi:MAG: HD family hydrolase [Acidobacteriota bacterium]
MTPSPKTISVDDVKVESQKELPASRQMADEIAGTIAFISEVIRLKAVPRMGWLLRGVRDVESVADHSFGVAFIAMLLADMGRRRGLMVDTERVLRMALFHDLTEARTGDLPNTVKRYFAPGALHAADNKAAEEMLGHLGLEGAEYLSLWNEYEARETIESRIVKTADKLDLLFQVREYEKGGAQNLAEFWQNSQPDLSVPQLPEFENLIAELFGALSQDRGGDG